ncbi:MAG: hypothetical protein QXO09_06210 [Candidatus Caldarchaeum sp.]
MNTLTVGDIIASVDRMLRTENLPLTNTDKIEFVQEVVADLTATEDILWDDIDIATTTTSRTYTLPPEVKYVIGVWMRLSGGDYIELAPAPVRVVEDAAANFTANTYSVLGRDLVLQRFPATAHSAGLRVKVVRTHPNISSLNTLTADTLLPRVYKRLAAVMTTRRILESFLGDEAMNWIQTLAQEEEMLRQRLPKATGRYGGLGMEKFAYASRGVKQIAGGGG